MSGQHIKRSILDRLCRELDLPPKHVLEALHLATSTIGQARHGIATTAEIAAALQPIGIAEPQPLLKALVDGGTIVWSYGCIEGWRMH